MLVHVSTAFLRTLYYSGSAHAGKLHDTFLIYRSDEPEAVCYSSLSHWRNAKGLSDNFVNFNAPLPVQTLRKRREGYFQVSVAQINKGILR